MNKLRTFTWRRPIRHLCWLALFGFIIGNFFAYIFARKMLIFSETGGTDRRHYSFATTFAILFEGVPKPRNIQTPSQFGIAYTTLVLRAEGKPTLEAWKIPCANPRATVALFHGHNAAKSQMLPAAKEFHAMGYDVWLLDFYGSGGSSGHATSIGYHEAEDIQRFVEFLKSEPSRRPLLLYGVSMGAAAITRAVGELGVDADGVILVSSYNRLRATVAHRVEAVGFPGSPLAELITFWGSVEMGINGFKLNPADFVRGIKCPALVLQGSSDVVVKPAEAKELFDNVAGPKTFVSFEGAGHESLLTRDPTKWRTEVSAWLGRLIARPRE